MARRSRFRRTRRIARLHSRAWIETWMAWRTALTTQESPGFIAGRGLKPALAIAHQLDLAGIARLHSRAWIETALAPSAPTTRGESPGFIAGRGLKLAGVFDPDGIDENRPAS